MKFNFLSKLNNATVNYQGAKAYKITPETELYTAVVTTGLNDSFYELGDNRLERIKKLISQCDPEFVARLAVYARTQMHLRSVPMVLAVELAKAASGTSAVSKTVSNVVQRADEICELLAYYQLANARTGTKKLNRLSKQVQKGLAVSFNKFDEYQFAKYNRSTDVKLRDALFLVHPRAKDDNQQAVFNKIAADALATPYTWETELSALGQQRFESPAAKAAAFKTKWEELIASKKMGYMALMRNLRNILDAGVSVAHLQMVCNYLASPTAVATSKQLPFRFLSAYRELKGHNSNFTSMVLDALEDAVMHSAKNIRGFGYNTSVVIACDVSGSMQQPVSKKSTVQLYDIGLMLGMLMQSRCKNVVSGMFGNTWKIINMPKRNVLANVMEYYKREGEVGYATNGYLVIDDLIRRKLIVDKVMLFTDLQLYNSNMSGYSFEVYWKRYKAIAPNAKLYLFDLAGHGATPLDIRQNDVYLIAGWSDKIFDILDSVGNAGSAVEKIKALELQ
ncbi:TROVE domain-containing protein [Flavobacterium subsaxonicum]|uniref:Ribonucleoprotein n=1 Tax=Flavobacterium subsaxonicum WB 4.1-42 = DSM 21790 TaxID=1121898 RepID=A0A0A2MKS9_9FLAO|nr:TROVE domain-containing protein [Flavobacterium subsaxonicum]KGO92919.1 ribonucleoprotein [Flavobacterium subsaxonicum WB 4.1-42 = DSM 21790]